MTKMVASVGLNDSLLALGDSIIHHTFGDGGANPDYVTKITTLHPPHSPILVENGVGGQTSVGADALMEGYLNTWRYCPLVTMGWGVNDIAVGISVPTFVAAMTSIVNKILAQRRIPIIPLLPYNTDPAVPNVPVYNAAIIASLWTLPGVRQGPDLYTLIHDNPSYLGPDGLHFTQAGYTAAVAAWADSLAWVYQ